MMETRQCIGTERFVMNKQITYWDGRATLGATYKNEDFYTITALPYYYERRKLIIQSLERILCKASVPHKRICDFGCGDGVYISRLSAKWTDLYFHGVDISPEMIKKARSHNKSEYISFEISENGIQKGYYDIVYSSAVFAHLKDDVVCSLMNNIYKHLYKRGMFILCEQCAPYRYEGDTYIRRTCSEYKEILNKAGFAVQKEFVIDFWAHRIFFERKIQKLFLHWAVKKYHATKDIALIKLNQNKLYRFISKCFTIASRPRIFAGGGRFGYVFIVAVK